MGVIAAATAVGCGDNSKRCGEGTEANDEGYCVPVETTTCGEGTTLMGDECVPDGTVICEQGTVFDEELGACVPSDEACAEGTVLVDGQCVADDDALTADLEEAAEPNDGLEAEDDIAGQFVLGGVGESTVIHGCVTPYRDADGDGSTDADVDLWVFQTAGPALVEITADGVDGLVSGFVMISATGNDALDNAWLRVGANLTGDTAQRQVYLPEAGVYGMFMTDSRSLFWDGNLQFFGPAVGNEETCYYTTIANVAVPTPTPIAADTEVAGDVGGDSIFYSYDAVEGDLFEVLHTLDSSAASPSVVVATAGKPSFYGEPAPIAGGFDADDNVMLVVEPVWNYALDPAPYTLEVNPFPVVALPTTGGTVTVTNTDGDFNTLDAATWAYFDVGADAVVHFDVATTTPVHMVITTPDLLVVSDITGFLSAPVEADAFDGWVRFPAPGRYYLLFWDEGEDTGTYDVTSTVTEQAATPVAIGTPVNDAALSALGSSWHLVDPGTAVWLALTAGATDFGGDAVVEIYDAAAIGTIDLEVFEIQTESFAADGSETGGRIVFGEGVDFLVRISDADPANTGASPTYDLGVANRDFTNLGLVNEGTPVAQMDLAITAGASRLYFVRFTPGNESTITVTPTAEDLVLEILDRDESAFVTIDDGGAAAAETVQVTVPTQGWVAFRVTNLGAADDTFDLDISTVAPVPYTTSAGTLTYTDICADANAVDLTPADDDEGFTSGTLGFNFQLFGLTTPADYDASANGFLSFGGLPDDGWYFNEALPNGGPPDGVVAPYWDDLWEVTMCVLEDADSATFQWTGTRFFATETVEMQAIVHSSGLIEFVYGPNHTADGASGTVGVESASGFVGHQVVFNEAGTVPASSSFVLTPTP